MARDVARWTAWPDLDRFWETQDDGDAGFAETLGELRAGRKTSRWTWYMFPQLRGLERSPMGRSWR